MAADQTKAKPVLKWAGGKRRLLPQILARMSPAVAKEGHIETYVEPFFGGGAMFFHLAEHFSFGRVVINDFNADLTLVYRVIQSRHVDALVEVLSRYRDRYIPLEHELRAELFYEVRSEYNRTRPQLDLAGDLGLSLIHISEPTRPY